MCWHIVEWIPILSEHVFFPTKPSSLFYFTPHSVSWSLFCTLYISARSQQRAVGAPIVSATGEIVEIIGGIKVLDCASAAHCLFHFFTLYLLCNSGGQKPMVLGSVLTLGKENSQWYTLENLKSTLRTLIKPSEEKGNSSVLCLNLKTNSLNLNNCVLCYKCDAARALSMLESESGLSLVNTDALRRNWISLCWTYDLTCGKFILDEKVNFRHYCH
jgi:hypothetical protein